MHHRNHGKRVKQLKERKKHYVKFAKYTTAASPTYHPLVIVIRVLLMGWMSASYRVDLIDPTPNCRTSSLQGCRMIPWLPRHLETGY